jgi:hypothetical protein
LHQNDATDKGRRQTARRETAQRTHLAFNVASRGFLALRLPLPLRAHNDHEQSAFTRSAQRQRTKEAGKQGAETRLNWQPQKGLTTCAKRSDVSPASARDVSLICITQARSAVGQGTL